MSGNKYNNLFGGYKEEPEDLQPVTPPAPPEEVETTERQPVATPPTVSGEERVVPKLSLSSASALLGRQTRDTPKTIHGGLQYPGEDSGLPVSPYANMNTAPAIGYSHSLPMDKISVAEAEHERLVKQQAKLTNKARMKRYFTWFVIFWVVISIIFTFAREQEASYKVEFGSSDYDWSNYYTPPPAPPVPVQPAPGTGTDNIAPDSSSIENRQDIIYQDEDFAIVLGEEGGDTSIAYSKSFLGENCEEVKSRGHGPFQQGDYAYNYYADEDTDNDGVVCD